MKKRSAMAMAAGLVAALLAGAAAISVGLTAPDTAQASKPADPIVRTIRETVTVHRKANADQTPTVRVIAAPATQTAPVTSQEAFGDDAFEDGEHDDGQYEDGEHDDGQYEDGQHDDGQYEDGQHDDGQYEDD